MQDKNILAGKSQNIVLNYNNGKKFNSSLKKTIKDNNLKFFSTRMSFYKSQKVELNSELRKKENKSSLETKSSLIPADGDLYFEVSDGKLKAMTESKD